MLRTRRIVSAVLAVVAAVLLLLSNIGWWADRYFLNSERFGEKANEILQKEDVQRALAVAITDEISKEAGADLRIAQPFVATIVQEVVQTDQFQKVFDTAVERLHNAVVQGGARNAVLDLSRIVDRVRNAIEPIAPNLADNIPTGERVRVRILDKTQLDTIYDSVNLVENVVIVLTVLTILCFAGAIAVSPRRWRTLALAGWVVLGLFVVQLVLVRVGRGLVGGFPEREEYSAAAEAAYKVISRGLAVQALVIAVIGLLVALGAGWTDRHGGWAGVTAAFRRARTWARAQMPTRAPAPALATAGTAPGAVSASPDVDMVGAGATASTEEPGGATPAVGTRTVTTGILAPRLPQPPRRVRAAHWWRAAGLLVLGLFAVFSPGSLTTVIVVLLGLAALYLALTEALAAWASPKEQPPADDTADEDSTAVGSDTEGA